MVISEEKKTGITRNQCLPRKGKLLIKKLFRRNQKFRYLDELHEVIESTDPCELEELMNFHQPDIIIFETSPERSLVEMKYCDLLKSKSKNLGIPIILIAREYSNNCYKLCAEIGADAYLKENFQWDLLPVLVENLMRSKEKSPDLHYKDDKPLAHEDSHFIMRVDRSILANIDDPDFNVASLCDELAMSRSLVYKKLKLLKGLSVVEYIRDKRIEEATHLLKSGKYRIFEVAYMVGFTNQKYFRKVFSRRYGIPPSKYACHTRLVHNETRKNHS